MAEHRKKVASLCVKNSANTGRTLEFFPASEWEGPEGFYRIRVGRKWMDGTHGAKRFFSTDEIAAVVAQHLFGGDLDTAARTPDRPEALGRGVRVSAPTGGEESPHEVTHVVTEAPMQGRDGRWYVGVHLYGRGVVMVPAEACILKHQASHAR